MAVRRRMLTKDGGNEPTGSAGDASISGTSYDPSNPEQDSPDGSLTPNPNTSGDGGRAGIDDVVEDWGPGGRTQGPAPAQGGGGSPKKPTPKPPPRPMGRTAASKSKPKSQSKSASKPKPKPKSRPQSKSRSTPKRKAAKRAR